MSAAAKWERKRKRVCSGGFLYERKNRQYIPIVPRKMPIFKKERVLRGKARERP